MADSFTEVSQVSWFTRIKNALAGLVFGFALFALSFPLLFWNEGRAVKTARSLAEGAKAVVSVGAEKADPANEGRLVHVTGMAQTSETLADPLFGLSAGALRLRRKVEMYQWTEKSETRTEKQLGGGEVKRTVYTYEPRWSDRSVSSSDFHEPSGHANPAGGLPYPSAEWSASKAAVGAFVLPASLLSQLDDFQPLEASAETAARLPADMAGKVKASGGVYYQGADPGRPAVGDVRVSFFSVAPQTVSLVSRQSGSTFEPYATKAGRDINMLTAGSSSADAMFKTAMEQNAILTWVLRAAGFLMMAIGLALLFEPLVVLADVIPPLGWLVGAGRALFCVAIAGALSLVTIAVAWIAYRPLIGGALLVAAALLFMKGFARREQSAPAPSRA